MQHKALLYFNPTPATISARALAGPLTHYLPSFLHPLNGASISQFLIIQLIEKHSCTHRDREPRPFPMQSESIKANSSRGIRNCILEADCFP